MKKISVLLVDDHTVVRQGLHALLLSAGDIEVVGEAEDGRRAVAQAKASQPEVVVMDVAMPRLNGYEATRQILKACPRARVLVLSSYRDKEHVSQVMSAGAVGYVLKHTAAGELLKAIRAVHRGQRFFSAGIAPLLEPPAGPAAPQNVAGKKHEPLSSREAEVLQLIAEGFLNKEIAGELGISIKTVEKHRQQVMNKLQLHDTAGLTRYALSRGIVERGGSALH